MARSQEMKSDGTYIVLTKAFEIHSMGRLGHKSLREFGKAYHICA